MNDAGKEKKIIIDEDWKTQVEAEKVAAEADRSEVKEGQGTDAVAQDAVAQESAPEAVAEPGAIPLPPADFTTIISMLATQAMLNLGSLPNPMTGKADKNLPQAKHAIDLIEVLQQKTAGNCNPQEASMMENLLHELRMAYVHVQNMPATEADEPATEAGDEE